MSSRLFRHAKEEDPHMKSTEEAAKTQKKTKEDEEAKKKADEEEKKALEDLNITSGDYQVQV